MGGEVFLNILEGKKMKKLFRQESEGKKISDGDEHNRKDSALSCLKQETL